MTCIHDMHACTQCKQSVTTYFTYTTYINTTCIRTHVHVCAHTTYHIHVHGMHCVRYIHTQTYMCIRTLHTCMRYIASTYIMCVAVRYIINTQMCNTRLTYRMYIQTCAHTHHRHIPSHHATLHNVLHTFIRVHKHGCDVPTDERTRHSLHKLYAPHIPDTYTHHTAVHARIHAHIAPAHARTHAYIHTNIHYIRHTTCIRTCTPAKRTPPPTHNTPKCKHTYVTQIHSMHDIQTQHAFETIKHSRHACKHTYTT